MRHERVWNRSAPLHAHETRAVVVDFVVGEPSAELAWTLAREREEFGDVMVLPGVREAMHMGKLRRWFHVAWRTYPDATFFMKADTDSFVNIARLVPLLERHLHEHQHLFLGRLVRANKNKKYYWQIAPDMKATKETWPYMNGYGYILGRELVKFLSTDAWVRRHEWGLEDFALGYWLRPVLGVKPDVRHAKPSEIHDWAGKRRASAHDPAPHANSSAVVHRVFSGEDFASLVTTLMPPNETREALTRAQLRVHEVPVVVVTVIRSVEEVDAGKGLLERFRDAPVVVFVPKVLWAPSASWRRGSKPVVVVPVATSVLAASRAWLSLAFMREAARKLTGVPARSFVFVRPHARAVCDAETLAAFAATGWAEAKAAVGWRSNHTKWVLVRPGPRPLQGGEADDSFVAASPTVVFSPELDPVAAWNSTPRSWIRSWPRLACSP